MNDTLNQPLFENVKTEVHKNIYYICIYSVLIILIYNVQLACFFSSVAHIFYKLFKYLQPLNFRL